MLRDVGGGTTGGTEVANQLTMRWRDYPGLFGEPNVMTRVLGSERGRQERQRSERCECWL